MEKLTASKAKELLMPIPKEDWITGEFTDEIGKCCAIGHLTRLTSGNPANYSIDNCRDFGKRKDLLRSASNAFLQKHLGHATPYDLSIVNNEDDVNGYTEDNPKDRVMHLIEDMIKAGY